MRTPIEYMKAAAKKSYGKKGDAIVKKNWDAIDAAIGGLSEDQRSRRAGPTPPTGAAAKVAVPATEYFDDGHPARSWRRRATSCPSPRSIPAGVVPTGTTKYEKRGIAVNVPEWIAENCIQCNQCSLRLPARLHPPHPASRKRLKDAPDGYRDQDAPPAQDSRAYQFRMQVCPLDCTGCGNCADVCPAKDQGSGHEAPGDSGQARKRTGSSL